MGCLFSAGPSNELSTVKPSLSINSGKNRFEKPMPAINTSPPIAHSRSMMNQFLTNRERKHLISNDALSTSTRIMLGPPFSNFSEFITQLYLTGVGGLTIDNLKSFQIKYLINVADEASVMKLSSNQFIVYDSFMIPENYVYEVYSDFEKITRLINEYIERKDGNVVVFCVAGMSRASTIVLAYAIKYLKMRLKDAFQHLQDIRCYGRPNIHYFAQLVRYEKECLGTNSVNMIEETLHKKVKKSRKSQAQAEAQQNKFIIPDFYRQEYPHLLKLEQEEAKNRLSKASEAVDSVGKNKSPPINEIIERDASRISKHSSSSQDLSHQVDWPQTNELRPFIVEKISYNIFIKEYEQARVKKCQPSTSTTLVK